MSKIFELFGYRLDAWNKKAEANCARAWCPFMDAECDGGGNRHQSKIELKNYPALAKNFPGKSVVQAGVCSLRVREGEQPWIVCPRRLLSLRGTSVTVAYQKFVKEQLAKYMPLSSGNTYRVWSEVKMKVGTMTDEDQEKYFDYTFDYVIAGSKRILLSEVAEMIGVTEKATRKMAEKNGFTLAQREEVLWIDDFPSDPVVIVEIMTSSTSGGDKKKRTQIAMAFEDAVINPEQHNGPGINYRQVWARMVSQLIVKSQVGMAWNGKTIWLIQDVLANYISSSTALDLQRYISDKSDEVNILSFGYGDIEGGLLDENILSLKESDFYAGPINEGDTHGGFAEIVKIGAPPPKEKLWSSLFAKPACAVFPV